MRLALPVVLLVCLRSAAQPAAPSAAEVTAAAARARDFMTGTLATRGGYLWTYSLDLKTRKGEFDAKDTEIWLQPRGGTPDLGLRFLALHRATGDQRYLDAAVAAGEALVWGQLASGGWDRRINFADEPSKLCYYRRDVEAGDGDGGKRFNVTLLDDNNTQHALRFLMELDQRLAGRHAGVRHAIEYGLRGLLALQFSNGAFPQRSAGLAQRDVPALRARFPQTWSRTWPKANWNEYFTTNDRLMTNTIDVLWLAAERYGRQDCRDAAIRAADWLLLAQLPQPQPVWAQQYTADMEPAWARKFEPPAATAGESGPLLQTLYDTWLRTGEQRFHDALVPAVEWFRRSRQPDGTWARFYELQTNRPLYVDTDYHLTYDRNAQLITHYTLKGKWGDPVLRDIAPNLSRPAAELRAERDRARTPDERAAAAAALAPRVRAALDALDAQGRWVVNDLIDLRAASLHLAVMADYLALLSPGGQRP